MNIPDYILSGILESYVLGTVSDQERREVECLSGIYPEVRQELDRLSLALENYALLHSVEPPADLQDRIRQRLTIGEVEPDPVEEDDPTVLPLHRERPVFQGAWMAAAAVGLLLIAFSYYLFSQLRSGQQRNEQLATTNTKLQKQNDQLQQQQLYNGQLLSLMRQPDTETVHLTAVKPGGPPTDLTVFWNRATKQVTLDVSTMPELTPNQQYQLWALVGGKPVDAGVFTNKVRAFTLQKQNPLIQQADQFAVTVEKLGGSPTPTLTALVAAGKVS